jgi:hypothetical protein
MMNLTKPNINSFRTTKKQRQNTHLRPTDPIIHMAFRSRIWETGSASDTAINVNCISLVDLIDDDTEEKGGFKMAENVSDYEQIVETVYLQDGTIRKVGFREGRWIAETKYDRVAVSKDGFLLYFGYSESGRAHSYQLFCNFAEMAIEGNDVDFLLLGQVAAAIGADYISFLD